MEFFQPSLTLIKEPDDEYTLHSVTLTPNCCFMGGRAELGVAPNVRLTREAVGVLLHIRNTRRPICLSVITPVKHQLGNIQLGGNSGKISVVAFAMVAGRLMGMSNISINDADRILVSDGTVIGCPADSSQWSAWVDFQAPGPRSLHVQGVVSAPTPGYQAVFTVASPQGINPRDLILDLNLKELSGVWPQVVTPIPAVYEDANYNGDHDTVLVRFPDGAAIQLEIQEVQ
jgi:hypothetical protein